MMGSKGNQLVDNLISQVSNKGVPVKVGETVNLNVKMLGTISNPDIRFNLKETATNLAEDLKLQAKDFAQAKIDSSKKAVNDTLQSLKKEAEAMKNEAVKQATDKLKEQLFSSRDTTTADSTKLNAAKPVDRLKESGKGLLKELDPFKKKK